MVFGGLGAEAPHAIEHLPGVLPAGRGECVVARADPRREGARLPVLDLGVGQALPLAEGKLAQIGIGGNRNVATLHNDLGALVSTRKVAAVDRVEVNILQPPRQMAHLASSGGIQGHVRLALNPAGEIPVRFAVPHEIPATHRSAY